MTPSDQPAFPEEPRHGAGEVRAFEVVLAHIEAAILDGRLRVGDRLPPERDLASRLSVSRPAIREAIRTLEAQGVVASRVGSGSSAGTHVISEHSHALGRLLRLQVALAQFPLAQVVGTRISLERSSAELAARHATPQGLERLDALVSQMAATHEREPFNELDTAFHVTIAQLGGNLLLADLTGAVRESLRAPILGAERRMPDWEALRDRLVGEHAQIARAIGDGEATLAGDLLEAHIRSAWQCLPLADQLG